MSAMKATASAFAKGSESRLPSLARNAALLWRQARAVAGAQLRAMVSDRAMLVTDFVLATAAPFAVQAAIWSAVFDASNDATLHGWTRRETLFYYAYALAFGRLNNGYDVIARMSEAVHEGSLEVHLARPFPFPLQRLFGFLGESALYALPIVMLVVVQACTSSDVSLALALLTRLPAAIGIVLGSQLLCFSLAFAIGATAFWVVKADVLLALLVATQAILGGVLLPPHLWPHLLRSIAEHNPFRYLIGGPAELLARPTSGSILEAALGITIWTALFVVVGTLAWRRGLRRYAGAGG